MNVAGCLKAKAGVVIKVFTIGDFSEKMLEKRWVSWCREKNPQLFTKDASKPNHFVQSYVLNSLA